jgi:subtilisin family serine protease
MSPRRAGLPIVALLAAALGLSACFGAPPPPPAPPAPPPPPPPAGPQCQALSTLSLESDSAAPVTYEAAVAAGDGTEYVSFEAASEAEVVEQVAEIEATVGPVAEVGEQTTVGILDVTPIDDPRYGAPPAIGPQKVAVDQANFDDAWANGEDGASVVVAVVDTGVENHVDLASNLLPGADFVGSGTCADPAGHGTHVAGILGQGDNTTGGIGGAPGVDILPVRVLGADGQGSSTAVGNGIRWAADQGADVINLSLGGSQSTAITNAVNYAISEGATVVAAAGNCGNATQPTSQCPQGLNTITYPAALANVIAVGALNTGLMTRASFSNNNSYVDIAAPGTSIDSTLPDDGYGTKSGTSMATPFVSAVAALILRDCDMIPAEVLSLIPSSASAVVSGFANLTMKLLDAAGASAICL